MVHEEKKLGKIVEELTMYFFSVGGNHISSKIEKNGRQVEITFESDYAPEYKNNLHYLTKYLNEPRNEGMEDIYWELAGCSEPGEGSQLLLIGVMIDKAEVQIEEDIVKIKLYKEMLD